MGCGASNANLPAVVVETEGTAETTAGDPATADTADGSAAAEAEAAGPSKGLAVDEDWMAQLEAQSAESAATKIQAVQRGRSARVEVEELKRRREELEERAEVYRGVVRAAEAALEKVRETHRLSHRQTRCR